MKSSYQMVLVSLIASIILIIGLFIYTKVFPKKKVPPLVLIILISLLPIISIFRNGAYESGDLTIHVSFAMPFFEALKTGHWVPVWNEYVLQGYGYPLYLFTYPLPYYFTALFHLLGFSFINSIKILLAASYIVSGIGMYLFVKEELRNTKAAFVSAIFYLFAPYHLVDMHFRVAFGETFAFLFLPFCFFAIKKLSTRLSTGWMLVTALFFALLILSHQAISLIAFVFLFAHAILLYIRSNQKKRFAIIVLLTFLLSFLLSSFYWLPLIIEARFTRLFSQGTISFPKFQEFIFSPWRLGFLYQGSHGELSFIVGHMHLLAILFSPVIFFMKKVKKLRTIVSFGVIKPNTKHLYYFSLLSFFLLFFLAQEISKPIWTHVFLLRGFQFSYRLLVFLVFFSSIIAGIVTSKIKTKTIVYFVVFLTISVTILNWGNRRAIPSLTDSVIKSSLLESLAKVGYGTTLWTNTDTLKPKKSNIELLKGSAYIQEVQRISTKHDYLIRVDSESAAFKENTLYFPNWKVYANNKPLSFNHQDSKYPGLMVFNLTKGVHKVEVLFFDTKLRIISRIISFSAMTIVIFYAIKTAAFLMIKKILYKISAERIDIENPYLSPFFSQQQKAYSFSEKYAKNKTVLEIGSGSGYGAHRLAQSAKKILAIDKDTISIEKSKKKFKKRNLAFLCADADTFISKQKFDCVISLQVLEHIPPKDLKNYLTVITACLNKNGICIISTPNAKTSSYNENPYHYKEYQGSELSSLLSRYFKTVSLYGLAGDDKVKEFEKIRKKTVLSFLAKDKLQIRKFIPRKLKQFLFDVATSANKAALHKKSKDFQKISEKNYKISEFNPEKSLDIIAVCTKSPRIPKTIKI